jgi:hypothetical protein
MAIIDTSLHGSTIPATYTGPGNLVGNCVNAFGKDVYGFFTSAGALVQINCGFAPLQVDITDVTGVLSWFWTLGLPATNSIKTATAAMTVDTTSAIVVTTDLAGNGQVTLSAALCGTGKVICFHVQG